MLLYSFKITPNNRKVEAFIAHFDLPIEIHQISFKHQEHFSEEFIAINPMSKVPALVDGDFKLWESNAILTYLAEKFPETNALPIDAEGRADADRWLHWQSCHLLPTQIAIKMGTEKDMNAFDPLFNVLESRLKDQTFMLSHRLPDVSIVDFGIAAYLITKLGNQYDYSGHPNVAKWRERMLNTKGFLETDIKFSP
ncbi:MAG: glutathione S-transferase family protein [Pseudomonadota bacterium]|nr:glutathione S-transferase family protein [Pseudomonadota bacterium]